VAQLRERENEIKEAGGSVAAIGLGDANYARLFREEAQITFPLLIDEQRVAYKAAGLKSGNVLHIFRRDNAASRSRARSAGFSQHSSGKNPFQLGASFVFGPGNRDVYAHLNRTFGDNASLQTLVDAVHGWNTAA
jgi:hypothetical protein